MKSSLEVLKACREGNINFLKELTKSGQSLEAIKDSNNKTSLHYCMENKRIDCAEFILKAWPECIDLQDSVGITALHLATVLNNTKMVDFLISEGADVQIADKEKHSAVHWSVVYAQVEALKLLLKAGARVDKPDIREAYPLHYAAQGCGAKDLESASVEIVTELVQAGGDPNCLDDLKRTPLHWAVTVGSLKGTAKLIELGSLVDKADNAGMRPIHCAASKGFTSLVTELVSVHGSDVDPMDKNGCTPLFYATSNGHLSTVEELIRLGANVDHQDSKGRTSSHCAAAKNEKKVFKTLIEKGANPWVKNMSGDSPLHEACFVGNQDMIDALIQHPSSTENIDTPNSAGQTALHIAAAKQNNKAIKTLVKKGADVNVIVTLQDGTQLTALNLVKGVSDCERSLLAAGARSVSDINEEASLKSSSKLKKIEEDPDYTEDAQSKDQAGLPPENEALNKEEQSTPANEPESDRTEGSQQQKWVEINEINPSVSSEQSSTTPRQNSKDNGSETSEKQSEPAKKNQNKIKLLSENNSGNKFFQKEPDSQRSSTRENKEDERDAGMLKSPKPLENSSRDRNNKNAPTITAKGETQSREHKPQKKHSVEKSVAEQKLQRKTSDEKSVAQQKPQRKTSDEKSADEYKVKSFPKGKESSDHRSSVEMRKWNRNTAKQKSRRPKSTGDLLSPRMSQMRYLMDKNQEVSKEISRQVHISVSNFEYTRFTARAISEYGRQMMRANLPTCHKGFPIFSTAKKKPSRRKRRRPVAKSASYSRSSSRESTSRSYTTSSSNSSSDSENENDKIKGSHSRPKHKDNQNTAPRPQTSMTHHRPYSTTTKPLDKGRPTTSSNKRVRSAYAPFLPNR